MRSIDSLHVLLFQAKGERPESTSAERRHQIPGLQQTPYLKLYLLRCDDNDTYKESSRRQIREWIKNNTLTADSKISLNNPEKHDAFEWLIVHVVLPNTPAASQPRTAKHASLGTTDSTDSIGSKTKWSGKSSRTIFERIRADVNGSSKSAFDRVVQIRIPKTSATQQAAASVLGPSELENQWQHLVEKLKLAILASFDSRVTQYEEDIRERDNQRHLPGWNFCTFFILKEGLAMGFENVGLLEDALIGYDELAVGLDVIVREQEAGGGDEPGGGFLPYSRELKGRLGEILNGSDKHSVGHAITRNSANMSNAIDQLDRRLFPIDASKKPYRDLILANNISISDFRAYIFSRQLELLLRAAHAPTIPDTPMDGQKATTSVKKEKEDLHLLAHVCERATEFIISGARTLRHELEAALTGDKGISISHIENADLITSNVVASWTYCSAVQVLMQTASSQLVLVEGPPDQMPNGQEGHAVMLAERESEVLPLPSSSSTSKPDSEARPSSQEILSPETHSVNGISEYDKAESNPIQSNRLARPRNGTEELASWRADLYLLARKVVEELGRRNGWFSDIATLDMPKRSGFSTTGDNIGVYLEGEPAINHVENGSKAGSTVTAGILPDLLINVVLSRDAFDALYEEVSMQSYRHFLTARKLKSAERVLSGIAVLKYLLGEYQLSASYFDRIAAFYSDARWALLEKTMLEFYADCLKRIGRREECVNVLLRLISSSAASDLGSCSVIVQPYLDDLWAYSQNLDRIFVAPLTDYFEITELQSNVYRREKKDAIHLDVSLRFLFGSEVDVPGGVQLFLVSSRDTQQIKITLHSGPVKLDYRAGTIALASKTILCGWYEIHSIEFTINKIRFVHEFAASGSGRSVTLDNHDSGQSVALRPLLIYPGVESFVARAVLSPYVDLTQPRSLLLELSSGWNDIQHCTIRMKAATAGLRLRLHEANLIEGGELIDSSERIQNTGHEISFSAFRADARVSVTIPYTLESPEIAVLNAKLEVIYVTEEGQYTYLDDVAVNTILPINVNVQDIFKLDALFSRFTISPATLVPLQLQNCQIQNVEDWSVEAGHTGTLTMDVFPRQPASLLYKFTRQTAESDSPKRQALSLIIEFTCLDEVVLSAVQRTFTKAISNSKISKLSRLLSNHLIDTLRSRWTEEDLEVVCLLQEMEIWSYEQIGWDAVLVGLDGGTEKETRHWLRDWHRQQGPISLASSTPPRHQIRIPVEVPSPSVMVSVSLELIRELQSTSTVAVGQPLAAELHIVHSQTWRGQPDEVAGPLEFSYEVIAAAEAWLIGGRRRGNFTADAGINQRFSIILLPQCSGHLVFPSVEITCSRLERAESGLIPVKRVEVPSQVDYKSHSRSMLVIPDLQETTITMDTESAGNRGSWLAHSESRS